MGYGDFKLFAALGAWFGWQALVPVILMASVIGAVVGIAMKFSSGLREGGYVPFGPFLAGAGLTAMIFGPGVHPARSSGFEPMAIRVGLTGGIGSGKSTVLQMLAQLGAAVIDADAISRGTTAAGGAAIAAIAARFGADFITADGALDRARMREHAYADPQARKHLEDIIHPLVGLESARQVQAALDAGARLHRFRHPAAGRVRPLAGAGRPGAGGGLLAPDPGGPRGRPKRSEARGSACHHRRTGGPRPAAGRGGHRDLQRGPDAGRNCGTKWNRWRATSGYDGSLCCNTPGPAQRDPLRISLQRTHPHLPATGAPVPPPRRAGSALATPSTITTRWPRSSRSWTWRPAPT